MIINKIDIHAFGRFRNKTIELSPGLNLITGGNEAGKTTLHSFISAVFFGMFKPYSKNKVYSESYQRYYPWAGGSYGGAVEYYWEGRHLRLERELTKNSDSVKLIDIQTGSDMTSLLEFDPVSRLPRANKHLGMNETLFRNTVFIDQFSSETDDALTREIGDLLTDTGSGKMSSVSVKEALKDLNKKKNELGTKKQSKSPLGSLALKLGGLKQELVNVRGLADNLKQRSNEIKRLETMLEELNEKKEKLKSYENLQKIKQAKDFIKRKEELSKEIDALNLSLSEIQVADEEEYEEFTKLAAERKILINKLEELRQAALELKNDYEELNNKAENLKSMILFDKEQTSLDLYLIKEAVLKEEEIKNNKDSFEPVVPDSIEDEQGYDEEDEDEEDYFNEPKEKKGRSAKKRRKDENKYERGARILSTICYALLPIGALCAAAGYFYDRLFYFAAIAVCLIYVMVFMLWNAFVKKSSDYVREAQSKEVEREPEIIIVKPDPLELVQDEIKRMCDKYASADAPQTIKLLEEEEQKANLLEQLSDRLVLLKAKQSENEQSVIDTLAQKKETEEKARAILSANKVENAQQYRALIDKSRTHGAEAQKLAAAKEAYEYLIKDVNLSEMEALASLAGEIGSEEKEDTGNADIFEASEMQLEPEKEEAISSVGAQNGQDLEEINDSITQITAALSSLRAQSETLISSARSVKEIVDDIDACETNIGQIEEEIDALSLAIRTIEALSSQIGTNFAEELNEYTSELVGKITKGKYISVKVNERLEIIVEDAEQKRFVPAGALSSGTIDQLYFAVRLAIADLLIKDKSAPIFLDDCFVRYDDARLENVLACIGGIAEKRQVIMLTCRSAEKRALDKARVRYTELSLV